MHCARRGGTYYEKGVKIMLEGELLARVARAAQMGCIGIDAVLDRAEDAALRQALCDQRAEYRAIEAEARSLARARGGRVRDVPKMAGRSARAMARMQTVLNSSGSHIAGMMIEGNTKGLIKNLRDLHAYTGSDVRTGAVARRMVAAELSNIDQMKPFL